MTSGAKATWVTVAVVAVAVAATTQFLRLRQRRATEEHEAEKVRQDHPIAVRVDTVRPRTVAGVVHVTGEVESPIAVDLVAKVVGRLERLRRADGGELKVGDRVEAGDVVAVLEHASLDAMVKQAEAAVLVARAAVEQAATGDANARRERERLENLFKTGSVTSQQRDQAATAAEAAAAALRLAQAQVTQAEAALGLARIGPSEASVAAPAAGRVAMKYVDEGNLVGPARPLVRLVSMDPLRVRAEIGEVHVPLLAPGRTAAEVSVDAYPGLVFTGRVDTVSPEVSRLTRTIRVEVSVPNPREFLKPGMFARLRILLRAGEDLLAVPDTAVIREERQTYVYVVEQSAARRRQVRLGRTDGVVHEVLEGLRDADKVVIGGRLMLFEGRKVTVTSEEPR